MITHLSAIFHSFFFFFASSISKLINGINGNFDKWNQLKMEKKSSSPRCCPTDVVFFVLKSRCANLDHGQ